MTSQEVWLAEAAGGGELVGVLVLDGGWVDQLYVSPDWTSQGIGARLMEVAKAQRPGGLDLWTFQANGGARRFYERHGFRVIELTEGANEEAAPDAHYRWRPS